MPIGALALLWSRGIAHRAGRALAVILGVAVMGLATGTAFVGGDLLERLFVADAEAEWGAVDLEARADSNAVHTLASSRLLETEGPPEILEAAPRLLLRGAVEAPGSSVSDVQVLGLGAEDDGLPAGTLVGGSGIDGHKALLRLAPGEVLVNERMAERAGVAVGDGLTLVVAVPRWLQDVAGRAAPVVHDPATALMDVVVAGVLTDAGSADLHRTSNVLLRRDVLARATGLDGYVTVTHLRLTDHDPATAQRALDGLANLSAVLELDIDPVRLDELALADEDGGLFRSILLFMAALVAAAAAVAVHGLILTSAEDRRRELATLRAIGARPRVVRRLVTVEAVVFGLTGVVLGTLLALPVGRWLTGVLVDHFADISTGRGREQVVLSDVLSWSPLLWGAVVSAVVVVLTARAAGRRVAAAPLDPILRGGIIGRPQRTPRGWTRTAAIAGGAGLLGVGLSAGSSVMFLGVSVLLGQRWVDRRRAASAAFGHEAAPADAAAALAQVDVRGALLGLVWAMVGAALLTDPSEGVQAGVGTLILAGMLAIGCGTVLVVPRLGAVASLVRGYLPKGGAQVAMLTAAAVASRDGRRSAVTVMTIGVVLFVVAALSVLGASQAVPLARQAGGFDVVVHSVAPLQGTALAAIEGVADAVAMSTADLPQSRYGVGADGGRTLRVVYPVRMLAATPEFAGVQGFGLADAVDDITSASQALMRVATERGIAVVDRAALPEGAKAGDAVVIEAGGKERRLRLIAVLDTYLLRGVLVSSADMAQVAQLRSPGFAVVRATAGGDADALADTIAAQLLAPGVTVETMAQIREDVVAVNRTFTDTFAVMLLLALAVSLGSIVAHVVRSGRERRAELALLRSLGLRRRAVVGSLAAEPVLATAVGGVLGLGLGLGLLRLLFAYTFGDLAFVVRWGQLGALTGATVLLVALSCTAAAAVVVPRRVDLALRDLG